MNFLTSSLMLVQQKTIEAFFAQYGVENPDIKVKLLPEITDLIYNFNMDVVKYEKETDEYKKKQLLTSLEELEAKIKEEFDAVVKS